MKTFRTIISALLIGFCVISAAYTGFYIKTYGGIAVSEYDSLRHSVYNDEGNLAALTSSLPNNVFVDYTVKPFMVVDANRRHFNGSVRDILTFDKKYPGEGKIDISDMQNYTRATRVLSVYKELMDNAHDERVKNKYEGYLKTYDELLGKGMSFEEIDRRSEIVKWEPMLLLFALSSFGTVILIVKVILLTGKAVTSIIGGLNE